MASAAPAAEILPPEGHEPLPPMAWPVVLYGNNFAHVPHAFKAGMATLRPVANGVGLAWAPVLELNSVLLCLAGGNVREPTDEMLVATLTRQGLRLFIRDLQSIDDQLGPEF